ncbi:hypothetical protein ACHAXS_000958 [Conticribra weissflogii]
MDSTCDGHTVNNGEIANFFNKTYVMKIQLSWCFENYSTLDSRLFYAGVFVYRLRHNKNHTKAQQTTQSDAMHDQCI